MIVIASDHAAFEAKESLKSFLSLHGFSVVDHGPSTSERCNYPDYAFKVVASIQKKEAEKGILLCGSGIGMSMAANRFKNVRAALCRTEEDANLSRAHNDANILCLGARSTSKIEIEKIAMTWLTKSFDGDRHCLRINLFDDLGEII